MDISGRYRLVQIHDIFLPMRRFLQAIALMLILSITASADWYSDGTWRSPDFWFYADHARFIAEPYTATLEDMKGAVEYAPPENLKITAVDAQDAEKQIEQALVYAPHTMVITFTGGAREFYENFRDEILIGAVWTRREQLYSIARSGNSVMITIERYSDGWLSFVDTTDAIRVYADPAYSASLKRYREENIDSISGTDEEKIRKICDLLSGVVYDSAEHRRMQENGYQVSDTDSHSVSGVVKGKAVCDGYTQAFIFAASCHGIKSFDVILYSPEGSHAICMVKTTDGWRFIDPMTGRVSLQGYSHLAWISNYKKENDYVLH